MRVARGAFVRVALIVSGLAASPVVRAENAREARAEARRLYDSGRYAESLPLFNQVLARKPHDLESLNRRGAVYLRMNRPDLAEADFTAATNSSAFLTYDAMHFDRQFAPDVAWVQSPWAYSMPHLYPSAFTNRGIARVMLGKDDEALADFNQAVTVWSAQGLGAGRWYNVGMGDAFNGIGRVYYRKGEFARSLDAYQRALSYNPSDPNAWVGHGTALAGLGDHARALADYGEALRLDPNHARAFGYRAMSLYHLGRDDESLNDCAASIGLDSSAPGTRQIRAAILARRGLNAEALAELDHAVKLDPRDASLRKDRGGVYNRLGRYAEALADLDEAVRLDPKNAKCYQNRAAANNGLARFDKALADADEAIRLDPRSAGARNNRGLALAGLGRYEHAVAELTESIRLDRRQVAAYLNRGSAYAQLGDLDLAAADYDEVARRAPDVARAYTGAGKVQDLLRLRARSAPTFDLAVNAPPAPSDAALANDRGNSLRASGDWSGAEAEFTRAVELDPKQGEAYALRGWSRLCAGDAPGAEADARAWLGLKGWRDGFAPYMALLGTLAAREGGRAMAAEAFLDEALANTHPETWPAPILRYLKGTLTAESLLSASDDTKKLTESRAVIGADLLARGRPATAAVHLKWAAERGVERSIARDLARASLLRSGLTARAD
jgi:tetratricopeptide (TPR) repeat protein